MTQTPLDSFESALLAQLRQQVAEHPARLPARPRRRLRLAAVGATGVAASVVAVFGLGGSGGSPAYAVDKTSDGDVVVTVHRLDDAAGLEGALRNRGIDADVSYDADGPGGTFGSGPDGQPLPEPPPAGEGGGEQGQVEVHGGEDAGAGPTLSGPGAPGDGEDDPCGLGDDPATLTQQGTDWVLRIPAGSPLQDRHVDLGTGADGALAVQYAGDQPGSMCGMVTVNRAPQERQ